MNKAILVVLMLFLPSACRLSGESETSSLKKIPRGQGYIAVLYSKAPDKSCTGALKNTQRVVASKMRAKQFMDRYRTIEMDDERIPYDVYFDESQMVNATNAGFVLCIKKSPFLGAGCTVAGVSDGVCYETGAQTVSTMDDVVVLIDQIKQAIPADLKDATPPR